MQSATNTVPHPIMVDLQTRVGRVEGDIKQTRKEGAERTVAFALLSKDVQDIKEDVGAISKGISKVLWTMVCAFITTAIGVVTTFVMTGGLNLIN